MFDLIVVGRNDRRWLGESGLSIRRWRHRGDASMRSATSRGQKPGRVIDATGMTRVARASSTRIRIPKARCWWILSMQNGLRQGIAAEFLGIDGMSYAPLSPTNYRAYRHWLGGLLGDPPEELDMSSVAAFRAPLPSGRSLSTRPISCRMRTVRLAVARVSRHAAHRRGARRRPGSSSRQGIEQGAVGFSTGARTTLAHGRDTVEFVELGEGSARGRRDLHVRAAGTNRRPRSWRRRRAEGMEVARQRAPAPLRALSDAVPERRAGSRASWSRSMRYARAERTYLRHLSVPCREARSRVSSMPGFTQEGGPEAILRRLPDPAQREEDRRIISTLTRSDALRPSSLPTCPPNRRLEGMNQRYRHRRQARARDRRDALRLAGRGNLSVGHLAAPPKSPAIRQQLDRDFMELVARPDYMVCSDITPAGPLPAPAQLRRLSAVPRSSPPGRR